ncbi:hypothetical protein ACUH7A_003100 [Yersinia enterocolitica]|uniref:Adhesin n=1 Tax=Yersinia intermedia TaxID=631 RepID=A0ABX6FE72_YERIN|nr:MULTISPECIES: hypothetical protein [Yersinia]CNL29783.1 Uncharacterised protein [Yersinia frederiksenii]EKN3530812.1 hypothetical protein [Yersinia enterocolitica]EKN3638182.1 hypothetical protein [Yersinia enterocolitica]EKN3834082.1 hypothetical protein [Yersinia enterocolitica]EKN6098170.1 hypothetical protein [Yersinia enterocolitica]
MLRAIFLFLSMLPMVSQASGYPKVNIKCGSDNYILFYGSTDVAVVLNNELLTKAKFANKSYANEAHSGLITAEQWSKDQGNNLLPIHYLFTLVLGEKDTATLTRQTVDKEGMQRDTPVVSNCLYSISNG